MQRFPILGAQPPKQQGPQFSVVQALAGLAQVIIAIAAYLQLNTPRAWWILGLGGALLGVTFGRPVVRWVRQRWRRRHDDRVARRGVLELRSLVRTFGKLVSPSTSDTLQAQLQEAFKNHHEMLQRLCVPSVHVFDEMLHNVNVRLDEEPTDTDHMLRALAELYTVVSAHSAACIQPVFRSMPKDARDLLSPEERGTLNSYRERYVAFHAAFTKFIEDLDPSLRAARLHQTYYVFRPDALN